MKNNKLNKKVMIIAGGSGGHVFPGLAVAHCLIKHGYHVVWLGSFNNIESKLVSQHGIDIKYIRMKGLSGKTIYKQFIVLFFLFFLSVYQSLKIIKYWKPNVVLGMGGYVSAPSGLATWLCGIPLIIHEQNQVIGLTNRFLSFFAKRVIQGFFKLDINHNIVMIGNPIRSTILGVPKPIDRWKNRTGPIRILVIGGSQGSHIFNKIMPKIAARFLNKLRIWHQSGKRDYKNVIQAYHKIDKNNYKIESFIDDIDQAYAWADLIISRSGALTVSEIVCVGLPAIFIPFPFHKDRQQYWNAAALVQVGAAKIVEQKYLTVDHLSVILKALDRKMLLNMANRARTLAIPNATQVVTQTIMQYL